MNNPVANMSDCVEKNAALRAENQRLTAELEKAKFDLDELRIQFQTPCNCSTVRIEYLEQQNQTLREGLKGLVESAAKILIRAGRDHAWFLDPNNESNIDKFAKSLTSAQSLLAATQQAESAAPKTPDLLGFSRVVLECRTGSLDGANIQETAAKFGLLSEVEVIEPCGDECACAEFGFPATCYRSTLPDAAAGTGDAPLEHPDA